MFVAIVGVGIIGAAAHGDYSDHSNHSDYHDHREYNDAALVAQINAKVEEYNNINRRMNDLCEHLDQEFRDRIEEITEDHYLIALSNASWDNKFSDLFEKVRNEIIEDMDSELAAENSQLEQIDNMIKRINEIAFQETKG